MHSAPMQRAKQWAIVVILAVCIVAAACVDMSAPKGPASISLLQLPSLFIVKGDTMRDTNGTALAPSVIAFNAAGDTLGGVAAQFFITDSLPVAHFSKGLLVGDSVGTVHVVGQIGSLQTPVTAIPVVAVAPESISTTPSVTDTLLVPVGADSASSIRTRGLAVTVFGTNGSTPVPVPGVIVTFTLTAPSPSSPLSVYLTDDAGTAAFSMIDTTDAGGQASRGLTANSRLLTKADSVAVVMVSARYKGQLLQPAPLKLTIPVKASFSSP